MKFIFQTYFFKTQFMWRKTCLQRSCAALKAFCLKRAPMEIALIDLDAMMV